MKILVAGASGLVGSALVESLEASGRSVARLVRATPRKPAEVFWDPVRGQVNSNDLDGVDAAVCLSGESVASARWTAKKKRAIRESRMETVGLLSKTLAAAERPPSVLVCASAVGFYGNNCGSEVLSEESPPGDGFLADVCRDWEAAANPARDKGIRVAHLRFGVVVSRKGGALSKMLPVFRAGLGGVLGSGEQYMSWVSIEDAVRIVRFAVENETVRGPVNTTSPNPVTNREFTKRLGSVLKRPAVLRVPAGVIRGALGEMGDALFLGSQRAIPKRLEDAGFSFQHSQIEHALRSALRE